ncbi:MAG TPA: transporter substrate-binding domain-containing protein [Vicinamibacteria bacterium]|nr:transporter substrate-binding domain-containing protein [Vicinamibacteria bacterium]
MSRRASTRRPRGSTSPSAPSTTPSRSSPSWASREVRLARDGRGRPLPLPFAGRLPQASSPPRAARIGGHDDHLPPPYPRRRSRPRRGLLPALLKGEGDVIAGGFTDTAARRQQVEFTPEVFPTRNVILTRKPRPAATTLASLAAEKVGTIKGSSMVEALTRAGVPASRVDDGIPAGGVAAALKGGRVTAAVDGVESALIALKADPELQIGAFVGPPESLAYGVRKDAPQLRAALAEYVTNLRRTPTWSRLVVKYFGESAPEILRRARAVE